MAPFCITTSPSPICKLACKGDLGDCRTPKGSALRCETELKSSRSQPTRLWKILLYCLKYKPGIVRIIDCVIILFSKLFFLQIFPSKIVGIYDDIRDTVLNIELIIFGNISY